MERNKYATITKKIIMKYIEKIDDCFSSQQLYEMMKIKGEKVGLTTIYRFLDELEKNGSVKKIYDDKVATYKYLEKCSNNNHFYLKCNNCGTIIHIDCDCIIELQNHILMNHNFKTDNKNIIIGGICEKCLGGKSSD